MKIKGVVKNLKIKEKINDNSKNISRNFSGAVVGSVGSVQIVPCSSLYFSRSMLLLLLLSRINCVRLCTTT